MFQLFQLSWSLLVPGACAAEVGVSAGVQAVTNDPFVVPAAVSLGVEVRPADWFGIGVTGLLSPAAGQSAWTPLMHTMYDDWKVSPDISRMSQAVALRGSVTPLRGTVGTLTTRVGIEAGIGFVHTRDDLDLLQAQGEPDYEATADEVHPAGLIGVVGEVRSGAWGGRLRIERMGYEETVGRTVQESKDLLWVGFELTRWYGGRRPAATRP
jgi:hypothetical protein